jgi:hypothetical protein
LELIKTFIRKFLKKKYLIIYWQKKSGIII